MSDATDIATIGDNEPPLGDRLKLKHEDLLAEVDALAKRAEEAPTEVADDAADGVVSKIIADATRVRKAINEVRESEKAPFMKAGREVDGTFVPYRERLENMAARLNKRLTDYKRRKEDEARAERQRIADAERARQERARQEQREREAEAARLEAEGRQAEAEAQLAQAIEAEKREREAHIDATLSQRQADARPAELARTRTGSTLSTLSTFWNFEIVDRPAVDLEALRPYLSDDAIDKAVRAAVRAGRRELKGVRIFEDHAARVRG